MNPTEGNNNGSFGFLKIFRGNKNGASQGAAISPSSATPQPIINTNLPPASQMNADIKQVGIEQDLSTQSAAISPSSATPQPIINTNLPPASQMNADIKQVGIEQDLSNATAQDSAHSAIAGSSSGYPSSSQMNADIKKIGQQNDIRQEKALNQQVAADVKPVAANTLPWNYAMDTLHTNISNPAVLNKITNNSAGIQFNGNGLSDGKGAIDSVTIGGHTYTDLGHINGAIKFVLSDNPSSANSSASHAQSLSPSHSFSSGAIADAHPTSPAPSAIADAHPISPSHILSGGAVTESSPISPSHILSGGAVTESSPISPSHTLSGGALASKDPATPGGAKLPTNIFAAQAAQTATDLAKDKTVPDSSFPPSSTYAVPRAQANANSNIIVGTGETAATAKNIADSGWAEKPVLNPVSPINEANSKTQASTDNQNIHYRPFER